MTIKSSWIFSVALGLSLVLIPSTGLLAQEAAAPPTQQQAQPAASQSQEPDPLKRERSDKEKFVAQKALKQELKGTYKTWLNQDVVWIITDEEAKSFKTLSNDEERESFIEQFW